LRLLARPKFLNSKFHDLWANNTGALAKKALDLFGALCNGERNARELDAD
jgi:hypothetical protein